ncbi:MAG: DUF4102 domain-containing protein [Gammaproteobacteria bacterium]|nr:MAG: DUF4102 domain-containing protein [Gammaproteobacteria bacterium]
MAQVKMTNVWLKSLKLPENARAEYRDSRVTGLILRVTPRGSMSWSVVYKPRSARTKRRWTIGTYPATSLADARRNAMDAIASAEKGEDIAERQRFERHAPTFSELANEYLERHAVNKKSGHHDRRMLEKDIIPPWKRLKAADVQRGDVPVRETSHRIPSDIPSRTTVCPEFDRRLAWTTQRAESHLQRRVGPQRLIRLPAPRRVVSVKGGCGALAGGMGLRVEHQQPVICEIDAINRSVGESAGIALVGCDCVVRVGEPIAPSPLRNHQIALQSRGSGRRRRRLAGDHPFVPVFHDVE